MQPELSYVQHNIAADLIVKCMKHSVPKVRMAESRRYRRWEGKTERQKSDFVKMLFGNAQSVPLFAVVQKWHLGKTGQGFRYTKRALISTSSSLLGD